MIKRAEVFFLPDLTTQSELGRRETQLQMFRLHLQYCENMMKTDGVVTNNVVPVAILFCCTFSFDIFKYIFVNPHPTVHKKATICLSIIFCTQGIFQYCGALLGRLLVVLGSRRHNTRKKVRY